MLEPILRAALAVLAVIALTRLNGLRSFSKMSSFDFALTVALGSVLATTIIDTDKDPAVAFGALVAIYLVQAAISIARIRWQSVERAVDNAPLLLLRDGRILHRNLRRGRISERDLFAHLRMAGLTDPDAAAAVILETTGDVSVIAADPERRIDPRIFAGVRGTGG
ncbi:DUF421 domain-containing protein [Roseivivax sp. CAU 1761]